MIYPPPTPFIKDDYYSENVDVYEISTADDFGNYDKYVNEEVLIPMDGDIMQLAKNVRLGLNTHHTRKRGEKIKIQY